MRRARMTQERLRQLSVFVETSKSKGTTLEELVREIQSCHEEIARMRKFVEFVLESTFEGLDLDGGATETEAASLGLIELRPVDPTDNEYGAEELYFPVWSS